MDEKIKEYLAFIGSKGGRVTGASKARTSEQARKAVQERWNRYRKAKEAAAKSGSDKASKR
ncbi:MAG: hypothetical protein EBR82_66965 [Caulobacteraceae bacterium]|nr:hypothetical protein [Caulobacteraceae bacterium]